MGHAHHHDHHAVSDANLLKTIGLNLVITVAEIIGGIFSGSLALLSDAMHNASDTMSAVISYFALKLAQKPNTITHTFGYKRAEILAALFNATTLIAIVCFLLWEAYQRFLTPQPIKTGLMLTVAVIGLFANFVAVYLLKDDAAHNLNIRSAYVHLLGDTLSSVVVIIGGLVMLFWKIYWLDPLLTVLIALYVLKETVVILLDVVHILLDATPKAVDLKRLQKDIEKIPGVRNMHHVHVRNVSDKDIHLEGHINLQKDMLVSRTCVLKKKIEAILGERYHIYHSTIQFEVDSCTGIELINS